MPSVEISKLHAIGPARAVVGNDVAQSGLRRTGAATASDRPGIAVEISASTGVDLTHAPVDFDRVRKLRAALQDGSYHVSPEKIADAMIASQVDIALLPEGKP
jgi:negative regulator of flagellin synthesis FlgM